jgi:serine/threonine-protein kinase HipA
VADRLVAWLYDTPVAVLTPVPDFRIQLEWRAEGIERWGLGSPVLSVGLPIGSPTGRRDMRGLDFFENMLPEGQALARIATLAGTRPVDTYGILSAYGRDCAGAVMLLPDGEVPGGAGDSGYSPMTLDDLRRVIGALDVAPLGAAPERGFRPSLAGFQRKALVGRDIRKVTAGNLVEEAITWGLRRRAAAAVVAGTLDQVLAAIPASAGDERVLAVIRAQAERVGSR